MSSTTKIKSKELNDRKNEVERLCTEKKLKGVSSFSRTASRFFGKGPKKINATSTIHDLLMINDFNRIHEIICIYNGNTKFINSFYEHINALIDLHAKLLIIPNINNIYLRRNKQQRESDWKIANNAANRITFPKSNDEKFNDEDFKRISHKAEIRKYAEKIEEMVKSENIDNKLFENSELFKKSGIRKRHIRDGPTLSRQLSEQALRTLSKSGLTSEVMASILNAPSSSKPSSSKHSKGGNMTRRKKRSN